MQDNKLDNYSFIRSPAKQFSYINKEFWWGHG